MPVLMYGSDPMAWRDKERSKIREVLRGNFSSLLVIRKIRMPKPRVRK